MLELDDRGEWSASRPGPALYPRGKDPGTHWIGWVGLRAAKDTEATAGITKLWGATSGWMLLVMGAQVVCMRDI
jgi:hypothetical protein